MDIPKYSCPHCKKIFSLKQDIKRHLYTHLDVKIFKCTSCGKHFKQNIGLLNHKKIHEEARLECELCDKIFVSASNYQKHQITHSDEKHFTCENCDKLFKRKADLKKHRKYSCIDSLSLSINKFCQKLRKNIPKVENQKIYCFYQTKNV